ncbi:hypothetical protein [Devosia sp. 2618]|uniref:hypothetical protein n=1 Tax=Devosia sp. 2618 TaxID=3156454 RepID=UPI00339AAC1F
MDILSERGDTPRRPTLASSVLKRAPRVLGVSVAAAAIAYVAMMPSTYEARAELRLAADANPAAETARLTGQPLLAQAVTLLPPDLIASLRQSATDTVDITALLGRQITVSPGTSDGTVRIAAVADKATSALAYTNAITESYLAVAAGSAPTVSNVREEQLLPHAGSLTPPADPRQQALYSKMAAALDARIALESRANLADSLLKQGNFYALSRDFDTTGALASRVDQLAELETERNELSVNLLPNHPTMRTITERIANLKKQLSNDGQQVADAARSAITAAQQTEASLQAEFEALNTASPTSTAGVDTSILTGSITDGTVQRAQAVVSPQPKLIRPELAGGLAAGLALFLQIGFLSLRRQKYETEEGYPLDEVEDEPYRHNVAVAPQPEPTLFDAEPEFDLRPPNAEEPMPVAEIVERIKVPVLDFTAIEPKPKKPKKQKAKREAPPAPVDEILPPLPQPAPVILTFPVVQPKPEPEADKPSIAYSNVITLNADGDFDRALAIADGICGSMIDGGFHVMLIDAASRRRTTSAGLSDLAAGRASFGEVVNREVDDNMDLISWGRRGAIDMDSRQVKVLISAVQQIYDAVIIILPGQTTVTQHRTISRH